MNETSLTKSSYASGEIYVWNNALATAIVKAEEVIDTYYQIRVNHDMKAVNY